MVLVPAFAFSEWDDFLAFTKLSVIEHYYHEEHRFGSKKKPIKKAALAPALAIKFDANQSL